MLEFKKSELEPLLLTISSYSAPKEGEIQKMVSGLLMEELTLGAKRRLQKIHKIAQKLYKEFLEDFNKIQEACKTGEDDNKKPIYDTEKLEKELKELLEETVKIDVEPLQFSFFENVSTSNNYNFDIIEKFAM